MADMKKLSGVDILGRRKALLITPELCTACRGCQTACKEWNHLPAERTQNRGSYENPPDLTPNLYNKIKFKEMGGKAGLEWLFISQRCMHCGDPGCLAICPAPGAIAKTGFGAVVYDKSRCIGCKLCRGGCPFDIPRYDADNKISKCHMCWDRVSEGMSPACSKVCPTGAISFGDRKDMIASAKRSGYKTVYGEKDLAGLGVLYAFKHDPQTYGFDASPELPGSVAFWLSVLKPLTVIGLGASVAAVAAHYLAVGPKEETEKEHLENLKDRLGVDEDTSKGGEG